ncbi:hypothetical protein [Hoeflea sp.]|uniref:hypothetical protein n=1 Tax=Hoeflea sp. TaxID=1940281 RepID=UPI003B52B208
MDQGREPVIDYVWRGKFREIEAVLKRQYPACSDNLDNHIWYADLVEGRDLETMLKKRVVCVPGFWDPGEDVSALIRQNIDRHFAEWRFDPEATPLRLRELSELKRSENEAMFRKLPVGYGPPLNQYMNDETVRLGEISDDSIVLQKACYLDQLGTNILCDVPLEGGRSFREMDLSDKGRPRPFSQSILANTIGVCGIFVDRDRNPVLRYRRQKRAGERMAIMDEGWHCTSSGVLTFSDVFRPGVEVRSISEVMRGLVRESNYETGIWEHENLYEGRVIAFGRELKRAGKPQFFHEIRFKTLNANEIIERIRTSFKVEGDEYAGQRDRLGVAGRIIDWFKIGGLGTDTDVLVDERLNLNVLTRQKLKAIADSGEIKMTFECFANLYLLCDA